MNLRMALFASAVGLFLLVLLSTALYFILKARKSSRESWATLFSRLQAVDREKIARVALDLEGGTSGGDEGTLVELTPSDIWDLVGGMKGLEILESNCDVLIEMAFYVQRTFPEAVVIAEQLRLSEREIKWHVSRLRGAAQTGNLESAFAGYAQRAVATYYRMTQVLIVLYESSNQPEAAALRASL